jgi:SpoIID/LytB domain protein
MSRLLKTRTALVALACLLVTTMTVAAPMPAGAHGGTLVVSGHGWGHGRGLGQYGALGYAFEHGWSSARILDHYYGGTTAGPVPGNAPVDPARVRVDLRAVRGRSTTVALTEGAIALRGPDDADLGHVTEGAVRLRWNGNGYDVDVAPGCGGPWTLQRSIVGVHIVRLLASSTATGPDGLLQSCGPSYRTWYQGELRAVMDQGSSRTVNVVTIDQYLRGVVPNEMPASWPTAALEAQAVAARSYAMAGDTRQQPYADTCDTVRCQVYDGAFTERGGFRSSTHPRTDVAVAATSGLVRLTSRGTVARTEFSSSTGGYTTGGDFPAVPDLGDAVTANPNHDWTLTLPVSRLENRYRLGAFRSAEVTRRNGLGADGGRVIEVELVFSGGRTTASGNEVRSVLGLKSDWFTFVGTSADALRATNDGVYVDRLYQTLGGRPATDTEVLHWVDVVRGGNRRALAEGLVRSGHFTGLLIDDLYTRALGRSADAPGRAYWVAEVGRGIDVRSVGILFFGSREYYERAGGTDEAFIAALYRDVLGREPDAEGRRYWLDLLAVDRVGLDDVAAGVYDSLENRTTRAVRLYQMLAGTDPSPELERALADRLLFVDDVVLAVEIASSPPVYGG